MSSNKIVIPPGTKFGKLTVKREHPERNNKGEVMYVCICDCGREKIVRSYDLRKGKVKSC